MTLGVVLNPTAGKGKAKDLAVAAELRRRGHHVIDLTAGDLAAATAGTRSAVVAGLDALVVAGGDGMTHLGVNAVAGTGLPLGIVAAGTGNDVARALRLPREDLAASVNAIEHGLANGPISVDAVHITDTRHTMGEWYCGVLSAGFDAAVNARANRLTWPRGESVYFRAVLAELRHYAPYGFEVHVDGREVYTGRAALVAVANAPYIGGGMAIAPDAMVDDGLLDIVIGGPLTRGELTRIFPRVYNGSHVRHSQVQVLRGAVATVHPRPDLGPFPPDAHTDGERVGPLPLTCTCAPGAVRVLVGEAYGRG